MTQPPPALPSGLPQPGEVTPIVHDTKTDIAADMPTSVPEHRQEGYLDKPVIVAMTTIPIYNTKHGVRTAKDFTQEAAHSATVSITPGQIFDSSDKLRRLGLDAKDIHRLLKQGHLMSTTVAGLSTLRKAPNAPAALSNTTGFKDLDKELGIRDGGLDEVPRNNPGVKWGYNPDGLDRNNLATLQRLIAQTDPGMDMPQSRKECIDLLSSQF